MEKSRPDSRGFKASRDPHPQTPPPPPPHPQPPPTPKPPPPPKKKKKNSPQTHNPKTQNPNPKPTTSHSPTPKPPPTPPTPPPPPPPPTLKTPPLIIVITYVIGWWDCFMLDVQIDGLGQNCSISSELAMQILQSCIKSSKWFAAISINLMVPI